jgi:hypothetical protein
MVGMAEMGDHIQVIDDGELLGGANGALVVRSKWLGGVNSLF